MADDSAPFPVNEERLLFLPMTKGSTPVRDFLDSDIFETIVEHEIEKRHFRIKWNINLRDVFACF